MQSSTEPVKTMAERTGGSFKIFFLSVEGGDVDLKKGIVNVTSDISNSLPFCI